MPIAAHVSLRIKLKGNSTLTGLYILLQITRRFLPAAIQVTSPRDKNEAGYFAIKNIPARAAPKRFARIAPARALRPNFAILAFAPS